MKFTVVEITSFYLISYSNEHLEERVALLYTAWYLEGPLSPQVDPGQSPCGDRKLAYKTEGN